MIALLKKHLDPHGRTIGVLGLAFKPDTDDIRESRAIPVIRLLLQEGAKVKAYDPEAMKHFKELFPGIIICSIRCGGAGIRCGVDCNGMEGV